MKISIRQKEQGGVLVTAVIICALIGIVIASFLSLTATRNRITLRSQAWNSAIPVLESGIEEALTHLHRDNLSTANGWTAVSVNGTTVYQKRRDLPTGVGYCLVTISNLNVLPGPVIYSRGFVPTPLGNGYISRLVRVTTESSSPFPNGLLAQKNIDFSGNVYFVRSFNSEDPNYSTNGLFIISRSKANAKVMTILGTPNAINVGNADIYGSVGTGVGGTVAVGANGSVGDQNWVTNSINNGKIEDGHITDDVNVYIPDVSAPNVSYFPPLVNATVGGTNYAYVMTGGNYRLDSVNMASKNQMYIGGDCTLYVPGNFSLSGGATIYIAPNSSLKLYVGKSANIGGGGIVNNTGVAKNLSIFGLPTCTDIKYSGGTDFIGVINAPRAAIAFSGGANIVGAVIGNTITLGGSGYFVYDEALNAGTSKFTITSYREL
jgi:hypothetical protein